MLCELICFFLIPLSAVLFMYNNKIFVVLFLDWNYNHLINTCKCAKHILISTQWRQKALMWNIVFSVNTLQKTPHKVQIQNTQFKFWLVISDSRSHIHMHTKKHHAMTFLFCQSPFAQTIKEIRIKISATIKKNK